MKRPSFQFYPGDWLSDLKLRRCSPAARGVWIDVLCALHDSDDGYGMVRWTLKELARTVGASMVHLRELVDKGVLRGSDTHVDEPLMGATTAAGDFNRSRKQLSDTVAAMHRGEAVPRNELRRLEQQVRELGEKANLAAHNAVKAVQDLAKLDTRKTAINYNRDGLTPNDREYPNLHSNSKVEDQAARASFETDQTTAYTVESLTADLRTRGSLANHRGRMPPG